ncbi:MAG: hypothetical protein QME64_11030 [bacterium]|nr:hypothetical protein [bacterium]
MTKGESMAVNTVNYDIFPGPNSVIIAGSGISIPIKRIILLRKKAQYGAVKFTKFWTKDIKNSFYTFFVGKNAQDVYTTYESYYQEDGSGDFSKKNIKVRKGILSYKPRPGFPPHPLILGNSYVRCGQFKLLWYGTDTTAFLFFCEDYDKIDYELELAPTKWTNISEVDVFNPRIKWYKYEGYRKNISIPIDKLWEDTTQKQELKGKDVPKSK